MTEPDRVHSACVVADRGAELPQPSWQVFNLEALEGAHDRAFRLEKEVGDGCCGRGCLVADREVEQQVTHAVNAEAGVQAPTDGTDAVE